MTTPNETLRAVRLGLRLSQDEFAKRLRAVGAEQGEPNEASKRLVQRWESGEVRAPGPVYVRAPSSPSTALVSSQHSDTARESHHGSIRCPVLRPTLTRRSRSTWPTDRNLVTGTWVEQTARDGYYQGARYHGAVQLLVDPTGRWMPGKWIGFGKEFDVNTGPWELRLLDRSTAVEIIAKYTTTPAE